MNRWHPERERTRLLLSMLTVAALLGVLWACFRIRFEVADDAEYMAYVAGFRTGTPTPSMLYCGYLWGLILSTLYRITGAVPWYTIAFMTLIYASLVAISKSMLKSAQRARFPLWLALCLFVALFIGVFSLYLVALQFTVVAAFCGAGALSLLLTAYEKDAKGQRTADMVFAALMMLFCFNIRAEIGYIALLLLVCSFVLRLLLDKGRWRGLALYMTVLAAVCGLSLGATRLYESGPEWKAYHAYKDARTQYTDFSHLPFEEYPEVYADVGWDEALYRLVDHWFFMDERVNTGSFQKLNDARDAYTVRAPLLQRFKTAATNARPMIGNPYCLFLAACLALICIACFVFLWRGTKDRWLSLLPLGYGLAAAALLLYTLMAYNGWLPQRVYAAMLFMAIVCAAVLLPYTYGALRSDGKERARHAWICCVIIAACIGLCGSIICVKKLGPPKWDQAHETTAGPAKEAYAVAHHENIYVYDASLLGTGDPFCTYTDIKPNNLIYWGGTAMFSPPYYEQLRSLGYGELYADSFFDERVYLLCASEPSGDFLAYMEGRFPGCVYTAVERLDGFAVYSFSLRQS